MEYSTRLKDQLSTRWRGCGHDNAVVSGTSRRKTKGAMTTVGTMASMRRKLDGLLEKRAEQRSVKMAVQPQPPLMVTMSFPSTPTIPKAPTPRA
ncbi:hypothetical protein Scep_009612 [Stephania cephalantha]|uniref:Uncharacterized protein n=1 Tax=Stephania cephalantha TaxID=152367 RepID=A0AAP0PGF2_9MAGN